MQIVPSDLKAINDLVRGFIPGVIYNFVGAKMAGKSLLTLQEACYLSSKLGGDIVIFDVDGAAEVFVAEWEEAFRLRYGDFGKIHVIPSYNQQIPAKSKLKFHLTLFEHFGVKARVELSEGGKASFIAYGIGKNKADELYKAGARYFIIDSFSQMFKDTFTGTQSFGERARAEDMLYGLLKTFLAEHRGCFMFVNHHVSINPMSGQIDISGGSAVIQNSKIALLMTKKTREPLGKIIIYRWPRKAPWSEERWIQFTDGGIYDYEPEGQ